MLQVCGIQGVHRYLANPGSVARRSHCTERDKQLSHWVAAGKFTNPATSEFNMPAYSNQGSRPGSDAFIRLARAGALTAIVDFTFSSVLVTVFYHSTFTRLWQGVASVPFGATAIGGGTRWTMIGIGLHICVAFTWSTLFLGLYLTFGWLRRVVGTPAGLLAVAAVYGPCIWMFMSFILIPSFTGRPPTVTYRWWVQFFGHIPFVAVPILTGIRGFRRIAIPIASPALD